MSTSTLITILSAVVGISGAVSIPMLQAVFGNTEGAYIGGIVALAGVAAGQIINALTKATKGNVVANAIVADSPVVAPGTTSATPPTVDGSHPTVLSTTSNLISKG